MIHAYRMETYGDGADLTTINAGTERYPYTPGCKPEDTLFRMDGKRVYKYAQKCGKGFLKRMCPDFDDEMEQVEAVIPHQSTMLGILSLKRHGIALNRIIITLEKYGNCVACR